MGPPSQPEGAQDVERARERFESAWHEGARPRVEDYVTSAAPAERGRLLRELLGTEARLRASTAEGRTDTPVDGTVDEPAAASVTLTVTSGPPKGRSLTFSGHDTFLVGRSKHAHLSVQDGYTSRNHFLLELSPPECRLVDLGSNNGTYVNGRRVQTADLRHGDTVRFGETTLLVSVAGAPRPAAGGEEVRTLDLPPGSAPTQPLSATLEPAPDRPAGGSDPTVPLPATLVRTESFVPPGAGRAAGLLPHDAGPPRISGYRIERELGRGGMGVVYLAVREADGQHVALKTITPAVSVGDKQVQRFLREAEILRQLEHPHIVAFRDVGESNGVLFFAMDFVEGTDAAKLLAREGPLPVRTALGIVCQLLVALEHAHAKRFVHRDVKPANLLVGREGGRKVVKVADFGLARMYQESRMSGLTMNGDVGGTLLFMPPEQITSFRGVGPAADQYAAAATLYNLLTGRFLFDPKGTSPVGLAMILQSPPVPIRDRRPDLPEELASAIHRALEKEAAARYPNVRAFRAALVPFAR